MGPDGAAREGALPGSERAAGAPGVLGGEARVGAALREHVLDPGPAGAGRPHLGLAPQLRAQVLELAIDLGDPREGRAVHRRVPLGDEGRAAERDRQDLRDLRGQRRAFVEVLVGLAGQADH